MDARRDATVAIAIPTRNGAGRIADAVASALAQTGGRIKVYVFDNASSDGAVEVASRLLPPAQVHAAAVNAGAAANFTRAFEGTDGDYFAWLADDDRLAPGFVAAALASLEREAAATGALPTIRFVDAATGQAFAVQSPNARLASDRPLVRLLALLDQSRWSETYALYRRALLAPAMPMADCYGGDVVLSWRVLLRGRFCLAPEAVLDYAVDLKKTPADLADSVSAPGNRINMNWPFSRLWLALWRQTREPGVPAGAARAGRLALLLLMPRRTARWHLIADVLDSIDRRLPGRPPPARLLRRSVMAVLAPRDAAKAVGRMVRRRSPAGRTS